MARSAAELKMMVAQANTEAEAAVMMLRQAVEKVAEVRIQYQGISDKLQGAVAYLNTADQSTAQAVASVNMAIDTANRYSANL